MKPQQLKYLRLNDRAPAEVDDLARELPVEIENFGEWFKFCQRLAEQYAWNYQLLTIDFNFVFDRTGPFFPQRELEARIYNKDFLDDPNLLNLRWPDSLVANDIGPNTGLLIGTQLVGQLSQSDLPCGVAFHTYHKEIVMYDMPSAMLITQMLLATGADLPTTDMRQTMSKAIDIVRASVKQPILGLGTAAKHFRRGFLQRTGATNGNKEAEIRLWMEPASLWTLLDIFRAADTKEDLDEKLSKFGIEFYDRNGSLKALDIRSIFVDRLFYKNEEDDLTYTQEHLPLEDVKPAGETNVQPGMVWQFVETLAARTPSNIAPIIAYFRDSETGSEPKSINEVIKRKIHRLLALIFAWLDLYAERWFAEQSQGYDAFTNNFVGSFPTLIEQVSALLKAYDNSRTSGSTSKSDEEFDPRMDYIPLFGPDNHSISAIARQIGAIPRSALHRSLRYDSEEGTVSSQKRMIALGRLVKSAVRWQCIEEERDPKSGEATGKYRLRDIAIPEQRPNRPNPSHIAQRLGFNLKPNQDPSKQLGRIIHETPGFDTFGVTEFLNSLDERPLPDHLKSLGWEFMEEFWGPGSDLQLPYEAWPICLSEVGREPHASTSLVQWKQGFERSLNAARAVQNLIMPSPIRIAFDRGAIWCWRQSAEDIGGDYYRIARGRGNQFRIYIGDVCGMGLPAALLVQEIHGLITALESQVPNTDQLCRQLDAALYERALGSPQQTDFTQLRLNNQWATLFCSVLDLDENTLTYTNAAHPPPLVVRRDGETLHLTHDERIPSRAVGLIPGSTYIAETISLMRGDRIVFFTDGLSETREQELLQHVKNNILLTSSNIGESFVRTLAGAKDLEDDRTLIIVSID